jgi:hypothetical protein
LFSAYFLKLYKIANMKTVQLYFIFVIEMVLYKQLCYKHLMKLFIQTQSTKSLNEQLHKQHTLTNRNHRKSSKAAYLFSYQEKTIKKNNKQAKKNSFNFSVTTIPYSVKSKIKTTKYLD